MGGTELIGEARDLAWFARTYERILVDTSVLQPSNAPILVQHKYRRELQKAAERHRNIFTIDEVFREARLVNVNSPNSSGIQKIKAETYEPLLTRFYEFLEPDARAVGIVDAEADSMQADLRLASMIFTLSATDSQRVVFLSSDRGLVDFVYSRNSYLRSKSERSPQSLQGKVKVYTLIQSLGKFFSYSDEKAQRNARARSRTWISFESGLLD